MRILTVTILLIATAMAGCLSDGNVDTYSAPTVDPKQQEVPARTFEPEVTFEVNYLEFESGENVVINWEVSDLHDYPFPLTFIDWTVKYSGAANFVAEGDGNELPGSYERIIYKEAYHKFTFTISDGQEFDEVHSIIIKVGDPVVEEIVEVVEEEAPLTGWVHDLKLQAPLPCWNCVESDPTGAHLPPPLGAKGCNGFMSGINYQDCAWVNVLPDSWGQPFQVTSIYLPDNTVNEPGAEGSVDVHFLDACRPDAESLGLEFIDHVHGGAGVYGVIPEGARCMVAFELEIPEAGVEFNFIWSEPLDGKFADEWFPVPGVSAWYDGVLVEPAQCVGAASACGPSSCPGMESGINGQGCAWFHVTPNMWNFEFSMIGAADSDGVALDECSVDGKSVGTTYGAFGPESAHIWLGKTIPEGTGCIYVSDWAGYSGVIQMEVFEAY